MKTRMRKQYYCEYCKKNGGHAGYIRNHEDSCTMNPDRECKMCSLNGSYNNLKDLLKIIPEPILKTVNEYCDLFNENFEKVTVENFEDIKNSLKQLRKEADDCPSCILAAIRQKTKNWHWQAIQAFEEFNFKKETASLFDSINQSGMY